MAKQQPPENQSLLEAITFGRDCAKVRQKSKASQKQRLPELVLHHLRGQKPPRRCVADNRVEWLLFARVFLCK